MDINDLQIGKAGEYLVCADLILKGHIAFPSEQGLSYDVVADINGKLIKIQVKTTRKSKYIPQRKSPIPAYIFHIGINGKRGRRKKYAKGSVDLFALVAIDTKRIAYIPFFDTQTTMNFRVPEFRGKYHDEQSVQIKEKVMSLKGDGLTMKQIAEKLNMKISNVHKYSANVSLKQKGSNCGTYFDSLTLEKCLSLRNRQRLLRRRS